MDDLLDQLDRSKFCLILDLAFGYWQVKVHPDSCEETAFITHQGLYEFRVMPFGLRNAPVVFRILMQCVLAGLNSPARKTRLCVGLPRQHDCVLMDPG